MNDKPKMMPGQSEYTVQELGRLDQLLNGALDAEDIFGLDELEIYAAGQKKGEKTMSAQVDREEERVLTSRRVREIFDDCLFRPEELPEEGLPEMVQVDGIVNNFGFHPQRLESHREEVKLLLNELPPSVKEGCSFVQLCVDKHGNHWAEHITIEQLISVAVGLKLARYCFPRSIWSALPGGMPYVIVLP